jgi:hypothetical protein
MVVPVGSRWSLDTAGPFTLTERGNKFLVIFYESATRWVEAFATADIRSTTIARLLVSEICARWGAPSVLVSDCARTFLTDLVQAVNEVFRVRHVTATPYHPMTVGGLERWNKVCGQMLRAYCSEQPKQWDEYVCLALLSYRSSAAAGLGDSPAFLMLGRDILWPIEATFTPIPIGYREVQDHRADMILRLQEAHKVAKAHTERQQREDKRRYDKKVRGANFVNGDRVWLEFPKSAAPIGSCRKLTVTRKGPMRIVETSYPCFAVRPCDKPRAKPVWVHANRLSFCYQPKLPTQELSEEELSEEEKVDLDGTDPFVMQFPGDWKERKTLRVVDNKNRDKAVGTEGVEEEGDDDGVGQGTKGHPQEHQQAPLTRHQPQTPRYSLRPRRTVNCTVQIQPPPGEWMDE